MNRHKSRPAGEESSGAPETAIRSNFLDRMLALISQEVKRTIDGGEAKKIIIFGAGARGVVVYETLKEMGIEVAYFVDSKKNDTRICGVQVFEPLKIMYENLEEVMVIVAAAYPAEMLEILKSIGLEDTRNVRCIFDRQSLDRRTNEATPTLIDFFLGYNRTSHPPGFQRFGGESAEERGEAGGLRIIALGGSTTDPAVMDPLEWEDPNTREESAGSWPRFLHELLNRRGIRNCVYNGGISGYTSAQELLKLQRDGLNLSPHLVISLDGINDAWPHFSYTKEFPKYHAYFKVLEEIIRPLLSKSQPKVSSGGSALIEGICFGLASSLPAWDEWHSNQRMMRAISKEFGIEYACCLQPPGMHLEDYLQSCDVAFRLRWFLWHFFNSTGQTLNHRAGRPEGQGLSGIDMQELMRNYLMNVFAQDPAAGDHLNFRNKGLEEFYRKGREIAAQSEYIIDLVDALNGHPDILFDDCHCTAKGNRLIAERMVKELEKRGILDRALSRARAEAS